MRYEDWDILLFPRDCKIPIKEFKVACHVVHDTEFSHSHGSYGLPTVCCFVPSLPAGTPFQISIHSWSIPAVSQFTRLYSKYAENVKLEARISFDGRLVASTSLDRGGPWPHLVAHAFDFSKNGDLELLKFPGFRKELLQQNYWSPADDLGRIKIVISEAFPRDSLSMPVERVKNIVTFSFQHAPLEILEASSIAWPNPSMWRRAPFTVSMPVPAYPSHDADSHAHSPRKRNNRPTVDSVAHSTKNGRQGMLPNMSAINVAKRFDQRHRHSSTASSSTSDSFGDANAYFEWLNGLGMTMGGISQCDGQDSNSSTQQSSEPGTNSSARNYVPFVHSFDTSMDMGPFTLAGFPPEDNSQFEQLKVPTNTPIAGGSIDYEAEGVSFPQLTHSSTPISLEMANSLLNQPIPAHLLAHHAHTRIPEVKSYKESQSQRASDASLQSAFMPSAANMTTNTVVSQVNSPQSQVSSDISQRISSMGELTACFGGASSEDTSFGGSRRSLQEKGLKRSRTFTLASSGVLDEDEPRRASPSIRLTPFIEDNTKVESQ
ncbi:hypothetical protein PT974_07809 [Cladobotryum mycophilum]|uniref:Uncharacterized protein n=1 Tax=Cladobotryum mycophilum TaxID=491253 RepID=A0ABR0SJ45_9HYPO